MKQAHWFPTALCSYYSLVGLIMMLSSIRDYWSLWALLSTNHTESQNKQCFIPSLSTLWLPQPPWSSKPKGCWYLIDLCSISVLHCDQFHGDITQVLCFTVLKGCITERWCNGTVIHYSKLVRHICPSISLDCLLCDISEFLFCALWKCLVDTMWHISTHAQMCAHVSVPLTQIE